MFTAPLYAISLCLASFLAVAPFPGSQSDRYTETWQQSFNVTAQPAVRLENVNGAISIEGWDRDEIAIEAVKTARHAADLSGATIDASYDENRVVIKTKIQSKRRGFLGIGKKASTASVAYQLKVPASAHLERVRSVNGPVTIQGVQGPVITESVNGGIEVTGLTQSARLHTVNGQITASYAASPQSGKIRAESVNGKIQLALPQLSDARVTAKTVNGAIHNDFGLAVKKRFPIGQSLNGTLGEGTVDVHLKTTNGRIELLHAPRH